MMRLGIFATAVLMLITPAQASNLFVKYDVSLTGLKIGDGSLSIDLKNDRYSIGGKGEMAAFGNFVSDGNATVNSSGKLSSSSLTPDRFDMKATEDGKPNTVSLTLKKGAVESQKIHPAQDRVNERIKVTDDHKRGVVDPLSAILFPAPKGLHRDSCNRTISIYDGRDRYDVVLRYKAKYQKTGGGKKRYSGGVLACKARYKPISGHRPNRKTIQQLAANKSMEVHLAEIPGQPYLLLYRASLMTPVGPLNVQNVKYKHSR